MTIATAPRTVVVRATVWFSYGVSQYGWELADVETDRRIGPIMGTRAEAIEAAQRQGLTLTKRGCCDVIGLRCAPSPRDPSECERCLLPLDREF